MSGGKRANLTSQISSQLDRVAMGGSAIPSRPSPTSSTGSLQTVRRKGNTVVDADELVIRRAVGRYKTGISREPCVVSTQMNLSRPYQTIHCDRSRKNILLLHQIAAHLLSP